MTTAWIALGKHGDQASAVPLLQEAWRTTGLTQHMIVAAPYTDIALRAPGVTPVIFPGDWQDLDGAYRFAKVSFDRVICPATYGNGFPIQKRFPSFQYDQWSRAGALDKWDSLPLTLKDNPDGIVAYPKEPYILLADHSESSPFEPIEDLASILTESFPTHTVVRLSGLRVPNICDFVPLYDRAACMVSIETAHLHLSKASKVPVVALVTDKPSLWHGSAWSKRFRLHVRYSDYPNRRSDIIHAIRNAISGDIPPTPEPIPEAPQFAYNASHMRVGDKVWCVWRKHPDAVSWRTELALHDGDKTLPVAVDGFEEYSHEDGRLFMFKGKPHLSLTISRSPLHGQNFSPCVVGYGELHCDGKVWTIRNLLRPQFGKNDFDGQEKNWCFFDWMGTLHCIYTVGPEHVVLELNGNKVVKQWKTPCPPCQFGQPRGGTQPVPYEGKWLRFVHMFQKNEKSDQFWTYHLGAIVMDLNPPFTVLKVSQRPILTGTEQFFPGHKFWKPRVIVCYGVVEDGDGWRLSCGLNDSQCVSVSITRSQLCL